MHNTPHFPLLPPFSVHEVLTAQGMDPNESAALSLKVAAGVGERACFCMFRGGGGRPGGRCLEKGPVGEGTSFTAFFSTSADQLKIYTPFPHTYPNVCSAQLGCQSS